MSGEFDLIHRFFRPLATAPGALGLGDDAALLTVGSTDDLVLTTDTIVESVHFLPDDPADSVGGKLLGVNLSDLAAMGAEPQAYLLSVAVPQAWSDERREAWLGGFARGLAQMQPLFRQGLLGGDTVAAPADLCLTATALGRVPSGSALRRSGARIGDAIFVSGSIGDAALGLRLAMDGVPPGVATAAAATLIDRYRWPRPRVTLGPRLRGLVHAAADVSDGLVADLAHICRASGVTAEIDATAIPLSDAAFHLLQFAPALRPLILTGGDDYELIFTAPAANQAAIDAAAVAADVAITCIGTIGPASVPPEAKPVRVMAAGEAMAIEDTGFEHFSRNRKK